MGCYHETCMITNAPILYEDEVVSYFLIDKGGKLSSGCYSFAYWSPLPYTIYGKYDDYGRVEVTPRASNDTLLSFINMMWRNDKDEVIANPYKSIRELYNPEVPVSLVTGGAYNLLRNVRPVMILKSVFDTILNEYKFTEYVKDEDGEYKYKDFGFEELIAVLPQFISEFVAVCEIKNYYSHTEYFYYEFLERNPFFAAMPIRAAGTNFDSAISISVLARSVQKNKTNLMEYFTELAKFGWLCKYIEDARITWHPMGHAGSQDYSIAAMTLRNKMGAAACESVRTRWGDEDEFTEEAEA